jgi:hypothetical protein
VRYRQKPVTSVYATALQVKECMRQLRNAREGRVKIAPHHSRPVIHRTTLRTTCRATYVRSAQLVRENAGSGFSVAQDISYNVRACLESKANRTTSNAMSVMRIDDCGFGPFCQMSEVTAGLPDVSPSCAVLHQSRTGGSSTELLGLFIWQTVPREEVFGIHCRTELSPIDAERQLPTKPQRFTHVENRTSPSIQAMSV